MSENRKETGKATVIRFKGDHPLSFESLTFGDITIKCPKSFCVVNNDGTVTAYCGDCIDAATGKMLDEKEMSVLRCSELTEIKAFDRNGEVNFLEIVYILFEYEQGGCRTLTDWNLRNFQLVTDVPNVPKLTVAQYDEIANYVRQKDKEENFANAIENDLSGDETYVNIAAFLKKNVSTFADDFDRVTDYTGEDEWNEFANIVNENGGAASYSFVSNKGTDDEIEQEVVLMKSEAEHFMEDIREADNGCERPKEGECTVTDLSGDKVDLAYVDEISYIDDVRL